MQSYVLVRFLRNKEPSKLNELEKWLKDCELQAMFKHPAIKQASLYKSNYFDEKQHFSANQPDYYALYRFEALNYKKIRDEITDLFRQTVALNRAPGFLETEQTLFYKESHKCNRIQPRISAYNPAFAGPAFTKFAIYGFSHSSDEKRREEYIQWYQVIRQHDVLRDFSPFDNALMWLLCPEEKYSEYVFTLYEFSPSDLTRAMDVMQGGYAVINWLRGSDLYVSKYSGLLSIEDELYKEF